MSAVSLPRSIAVPGTAAAAARLPAPALLALKGAVKHYPAGNGLVQALDGIDLNVRAGETLGLVGESGCGKSTVARVATRLTPLTAGQLLLEGQDLTHATGPALKPLRQRLQMVFQDPYASLNPRSTIGRALEEPLIVQGLAGTAERRERVAAALIRVGLPADAASRFPHEFSGGQRQRVGIARALMPQPGLIICDEAVSALDVSIRAQVLNLLLDLRRDLGMAYLFISHDLAVVRHMSDRIAVMYLGRVVEEGPGDAVWRQRLHPYTQALMAAIPSPRPAARRGPRAMLGGDPPSPLNPPAGCRFHPRCPLASARCREEAPPLRSVDGGHRVACHLV